MKIFECLAQHTLEKATHVTQWASLMDTSVGVTAKKPFFISWQISQFGHLFGLWDAYFNSVVSVAVLKAICRKNDNVEPKCKKNCVTEFMVTHFLNSKVGYYVRIYARSYNTGFVMLVV